MTPETQQARAGYRRPDVRGRGGASPQLTARAKRAREDASIVGVIPLLAVLVVTIAGVYIAWREGSAGGGEGGVVAGAALLVGALARLLIPVRLAGLLATRKRATDVVTLAIFGAALLVVGLVLPR
jgi:K+ transporter